MAWIVWWIAVWITAWLTGEFRRKHHRRRHSLMFITSIRAQAKPAWVVREIIRLKALMPDAGCRSIANIFNRRCAVSRKMTVSKTFVADTIRRHRYEIEIVRRKIKHRVPPSLPRNIVWGLDLTGKTDAAGDLHMTFGLIDHGSRALLNLVALPNKCSWTLLGYLFLAIGKYGKPRVLRTDNEACFTSRLFRAGLWLAGIRQQKSDPGCPWQNGRIERLFGTLKGKLDWLEVATFDALNIALGEFRFWYNQVRPHQNLGGRTPAEAWMGVNPFAATIKNEYWFEAWDGLLQGFYLRR